MRSRSQHTDRSRRLLFFLAAVIAALAAISSFTTASASASPGTETRVGALTIAGEVLVGPPEHITPGQQLENNATAPDFMVATGVAANSGSARFIASSDGVVTDLVGSRNAILIGHYPEYVANAQATGARTFSMADDAWNAMSPTEQWVRNQRFLDDAISRGSQIQLATPLSQVRAGSFLEREIGYLSGRGYMPNSSGTLMIPGGG